jgi:hypothetical protein
VDEAAQQTEADRRASIDEYIDALPHKRFRRLERRADRLELTAYEYLYLSPEERHRCEERRSRERKVQRALMVYEVVKACLGLALFLGLMYLVRELLAT